MAALSECVRFSDVDGKTVLSIEPSNENNQIIMSLKAKKISIYCVDDHRLLRCWSLRHSVKLTTPAVYDSHASQYICTQNERELRIWPPDEVNHDKSKKKMAAKPIERIFAVETSEPIVVFRDLSLCLLSCVKDAAHARLLATDTLVWCDVATRESCVYLVALVTDAAGVSRLCCVSMTRDGCVSERSVCHQFTHPAHQTCVSASLMLGDTIQVSTLWSSGVVQQTSYNDADERWSADTELRVEGLDPYSMAIVCVGQCLVAVAGVSHRDTVGVAIFNTKFGSMLCFQSYLHPHTGTTKLFHVCDHILAVCGDALYSYTLTLHPSTLLSVLGTQTLDTPSHTLLSLYNWSDDIDTVANNTGEISKLFAKLLADNQIVKARFESHLEELVRLLSADDHRHLWCSQQMVAVLNRCVTDPRLWSSTAMWHVISHGRVPPSCVKGIFDALMKMKENRLLSAALTDIKDIPESVVVRVIDYVLSSDTDLEKSQKKKARKPSAIGTSTEGSLPTDKALFINTILSLPYNDIFLLESLRSLKFTHVLMVLDHLHFLMMDDAKRETHNTSPNVKTEIVVDWLCLMVDAHCTQLILSPDARPILVRLHQMVLSQVEFYDSLIELDALLSVMKAKSTLPCVTAIGDYCIEVLHLA